MNVLIIWVLLGIFLIAACSNKPEQQTQENMASECEEQFREVRSAHAE